jgi:alanine-synthesizing transaminase
MFAWATIPDSQAEMGSLDFAIRLLEEAKVAVSPGVGFGPAGEGHVRFALVENEQRITQATRGIRRALERMS